MEPKRILQVAAIMNRGGLETMLMNYYRSIDRSKIQFDFMVHRQQRGTYDDEIEKLGGYIYRMPPINPFKHLKYLNALDSFFKSHPGYKIVHSHINAYSMYVLRAARQHAVPCTIVHSHIAKATLSLKTPFLIYTKSQVSKYCTYRFACGVAAGKWLYGNNEKRITILNNAVNTVDFIYNAETAKKVKRILNIAGRLVIGHIGRFERQKNHSFLIDVFSQIVQLRPNSILLLIGDGPLRTNIENKINKLKLTSKVILLGERNDIPEILQALDVMVFPSLYEGLPVTLIEAQAAGLPCIASDKISSEVKITDLVHFVSLKKPASYWAEHVINCNLEKKNTFNEIVSCGYDVKENAKWLQEFYLSNIKKTIGEN
jgi:glycosyltransferase involved in cell wall biosynthesis